MIKKCVGCGSVLQDKNHDAFGFTPDIKNKYCERCFKLKNYNEKKVVNLKYTNDEIIALLNKKATSVFFVTDFINISKYVIDVFNSIKVNKFLVINKVDYISKDIKKEKYINYIKETYSISSPILLVSALKKYNLNELNNKIALSKNSYIAGFTNSGKSSLVNSLLLLNNKKSLILESLMPNTTLDVIKVKLNEETWIYN